MAIAPRFTPSIGNVGSMPVPKAQADPTMAVAFDTLSKVFGNAVDVAERVAAKQDAYRGAKIASYADEYNALRDGNYAELIERTKGDPEKISAEKYDDGRDAFISKKKMSSEDAEEFRNRTQPLAIRDKVRFDSYAGKAFSEHAAKSYSVSIETGMKIESERLALGQDTVDDRSRRVSDMVRLGDVLGEPKVVTENKIKKADEQVATAALDNLVIARAEPRTIVDFYNKHRGVFGDNEKYAEQRAAAAVKEVEGGELLSSSAVMLPNGNIDASATQRNIYKSQRDDEHGRSALYQLNKKLSIQEGELQTIRQNLNAMMIDNLSGVRGVNEDKYNPGAVIAKARVMGLERMSPDYQAEFLANARKTPEEVARDNNNALAWAKIDDRQLDKLVADLNEGRALGRASDIEQMKIAVTELVSQRDSAIGKMKSQVYNKVMARLGGEPKVDPDMAYEDTAEATRKFAMVAEVMSTLPKGADEAAIDKAVSELFSKRTVGVVGLGDLTGGLYERATQMAASLEITPEKLLEEARIRYPNLSPSERVNVWHSAELARRAATAERAAGMQAEDPFTTGPSIPWQYRMSGEP